MESDNNVYMHMHGHKKDQLVQCFLYFIFLLSSSMIVISVVP